MTTLRIRWAGGEVVAEPGDPIRLGRDRQGEIVVDNANVSRQHADVSFSNGVWVLRDLGSAQGTWRDGRQVDSVEIRGTVQVTLGKEGRGELVTLDAAAGPRADTGPIGGVEATVLPGADPGPVAETVITGATAERPGGRLRANAVVGDTVVTGDAINVECGGQSYRFTPGRDVTIGREDTCEVVSTNPTVSRDHARLTHDGTGWILHDVGSSSGTYVDGERITERRLTGSTAAWLGDEATGERLVLVTSGENRRSTPTGAAKRLPMATGAALVVALLVVVFLITRDPDGPEVGASNEDLGRATVRLIAGNSVGSGTIVDADEGLILTNAHVVAPDAPGTAVAQFLFDFELDESPAQVQVHVVPRLGDAAEPRFIAEVVAVDGYADLAVLRITKTIGGQLVEVNSDDFDDFDDLVEVDLGDSDSIAVGESIRVFGYPTAAQSAGVTLTEGSVSSAVKDERMGSNRAMLNISADISPGNSGGLAAGEDGRLVGIPTLIRNDEVPSMRPSRYAVPLIESARSGEEYVSPWIRELTTEQIVDVAIVAPGPREGIRFDCTTGPLESIARGAIGVAIEFEGFVPGEHHDLLLVAYDGDREVTSPVVASALGIGALTAEYPVDWASEAGCATITIPLIDVPDDLANLKVIVGLGPDHDTTP